MEKEKEEEVDQREQRYEQTRDLLKDFPNLKVGGLLPDPENSREGEMVYEMLEWTVIVFLRGQGQGKKVIHPGPVYNSPLKE